MTAHERPTRRPARRRQAPDVTVILPTLNAEATFEPALCSVLDQPFRYLSQVQIMVADGGSTDQTLEIASLYEDEGVTVCDAGRRDAPGAINAALGQARGRFVLILSADDLLAPCALPDWLAAMDEPDDRDADPDGRGKDILACAVQRIDEDDVALPGGLSEPPRSLTTLLRGVTGTHGLSSMLIRRELIDRLGELNRRWPLAYAYEWQCRLASHRLPLATTGRPFVVKRDHPRRLSRALCFDHALESAQVARTYLSCVPESRRVGLAQQIDERIELCNLAAVRASRMGEADLWRRIIARQASLAEDHLRQTLLERARRDAPLLEAEDPARAHPESLGPWRAATRPDTSVPRRRAA